MFPQFCYMFEQNTRFDFGYKLLSCSRTNFRSFQVLADWLFTCRFYVVCLFFSSVVVSGVSASKPATTFRSAAGSLFSVVCFIAGCLFILVVYSCLFISVVYSWFLFGRRLFMHPPVVYLMSHSSATPRRIQWSGF